MNTHGKKYEPEHLEQLLPYCKTITQQQAIRAVLEHGSCRAAAKATGIAHNSIGERIRLVSRYAAERGWAPEHDWNKTTPEGYHAKGVSTYYDKDGNPRGQWVKAQKNRDEETLQVIEEALKDRFSRVDPLKRIPGPRKVLNKDLMPAIVLSDPHIGMYAWGEETGADWDLGIARRMITGAVNYLIDAAPSTETCLIANLGDYYHAENQEGLTVRGKNPLDVDSRWQKVVTVGIEMLVSSIDHALTKFKLVRVVNKPGNHDPHAGIMLNAALAQAYRNNPRVEFDMTPSYYSYTRFGQSLIGITHGDKRVKPHELALMMANDRPDDWSAAKHRYWYTGHVHHTKKIEPTGSNCLVESFRILAGQDRWHHGEGYRAGRELQAILHHREYGEIGRNRVTPDMLRSAA